MSRFFAVPSADPDQRRHRTPRRYRRRPVSDGDVRGRCADIISCAFGTGSGVGDLILRTRGADAMAISMKVARVRVDDNHVPKLEFEKLLRVVGTFSIEIDRSELLREAEFPFVEFATQLSAWLASGCVSGFDYVSMESDDRSLVYFRPQDSRWEVRAMLGQRGKLGVVSADELRDAVSKFFFGSLLRRRSWSRCEGTDRCPSNIGRVERRRGRRHRAGRF